jgi:hypothetical protein
MCAWVDFGSFALAPNRVDDVRRNDWKFGAVFLTPFAFCVTAMPARIAAGFSTA